ncbi:hypothetical protein RND81_06G159300 [Saponaria officinalis]|uniref:N-acetylglucosaminylphosphatidylinositol deacetylase n=1 Tax=Saponaria officinalis TaxID=3572 RepID=A0AAW1KC72_SAPOF
MDWIILVISILVIWVASICKILMLSLFPSSVEHFNNGDVLGRKAFLLVIAHPDDESMFFTPTINYLTSRGHDIHVICLSTGNADGIGKIRKDELYKACGTLKVPLSQVAVVDHPELQDGFGKVWNHTLIAKFVEESIKAHDIDTVITFDSFGVSGHCNHRDVNYGVRKLLLDCPQIGIEAWELISTNILRKYSGPLDIWLSSYMAWHHRDRKPLCLINEHPLRSFRAMAQHESQWVWFRKLFVSFSSYTFVNTLQRIQV